MMPTVFILNLSYTGLGLARSFSRAGIKVYGMGSNKWAFGNVSRYVRFFHSPDSFAQPSELCRFIIEKAKKEIEKPVIFPTRDHDVIFLDKFRENLEPYFIIPQPAHPILDVVFNKWKLYNISKECKVAAPISYLIKSETELRQISSEIKYPVLLKPVYATDWRRDKIWKIIERKAIFVRSGKDILSEYGKFSHLAPTLLVQEYITGDDNDIFTFCSYCNKNSEIISSFNTRKIVQVPEKFGTGVVVQSVVNDDITQSSERLLRHIGFSGVSEIEYKQDPQTGNYYLIEINPRFWDQHTLSESFGINLPLIVYYDLLGKGAPFSYCSKELQETSWIAEDTFVQYCLSNLVIKGFKLKTIRQILHGTKRYAIWDAKDPLPFFMSMTSTIYVMAKRMIKGLLKD